MSSTIHVFDFLARLPGEVPRGICPLFGSQRFLQQLAVRRLVDWLCEDNSEFSKSEFDGEKCEWLEVMDELSTRTLFGGGGPRIVVIDDADNFVQAYRADLESLHKNPPRAGLLVLRVKTWPSNTRLYKLVDEGGLQIHCDAPNQGRSKSPDEARIAKWLAQRAKSEYQFELPLACAPVIIELTNYDFGLMDQELAKLSLFAGKQVLDPATVRRIVGGWPEQTMWAAIDAAADGRAGQALEMLDLLIRSGEHPLAMFGQISWSLRRYAEVGELTLSSHRVRRRVDLPTLIRQAGFRDWQGEVKAAEQRLKKMGRERVWKLLDWIVETDLALKRSHSREERGRLALEKLFVRLADELAPAR
jgi:DNA polymerase-3 subunit delta